MLVTIKAGSWVHRVSGAAGSAETASVFPQLHIEMQNKQANNMCYKTQMLTQPTLCR